MRQRWTMWCLAVAIATGLFASVAAVGNAGTANCGLSVNWKHWDNDFEYYHFDHNGGDHPSPEPLFVQHSSYPDQTNFHASLQPGAGWDHIIPDAQQAHVACTA